jgi:1-acyl-sn-glycerol-3-phosphate acyltransferase
MIKTFFIWILAIILTVFWGTVSILSSLIDKTGQSGFKCMQLWARALLKLGGVKFRTEGFENLPMDKNYLFVSNHQSQVDIIALAAALPIKFGWMAKKSLFKVPFLGWHMTRMGYVPIDRGNISSQTSGLVKASRSLKGGNSLVIFPEGSRSKDGKLRPFKDGAFYIALESGTPIVPVTINGTGDIIRKGSYKINPGDVKIVASGVIDVASYQHGDREKLKELVRGNILANLLQPQ